MASYHVDNGLAGTQQSMTTTYKTLLEGTSATYRWYINGFNVGAAGLPSSTDCELVTDISRITASGTGTATTALPLDPADAASPTTWKGNMTIESGSITATSSVAYVSMNQRATYSWQTNDRSQMLIAPVTASNGFVLRTKSSTYTNTVGGTIYYQI